MWLIYIHGRVLVDESVNIISKFRFEKANNKLLSVSLRNYRQIIVIMGGGAQLLVADYNSDPNFFI